MNLCQVLVTIVLQMVILVLYSTVVDFDIGGSGYQALYPQLMDLNVMVFIGFGFIKVFLRNHSFTSIAYSLFIAIWSMQVTILFRGAWLAIWDKDDFTDDDGNFFVNLLSFVHASYAAATLLIAFGAVLGKVNSFQLLFMAISGSFFYTLNQALAFYEFEISDVGGAVLIHLFGACFGLACAKALSRKEWLIEPNHVAYSRHTILYAMLGTLFLFVYFPSFNGLLAILIAPATQELVFMNTLLALIGAVVMAFVTSAILNRGKFYMEDILFASLAGGVMIASGSVASQQPYAALLIGNFAGALCVIGQKYFTPFLTNKLKWHDTCGVLNVHLIPGFLGGFVGMLMLKDSESDFERIFGPDQDDNEKNEDQVAMIFITIGIALASGFLTGLILRIDAIFKGPKQLEDLFHDRFHFVMTHHGADEISIAHSDHSTHADHHKYNIPMHGKQGEELKHFIQQQIDVYAQRHPQQRIGGGNNVVIQDNPHQFNNPDRAVIIPEQPGVNQPMAQKQSRPLPF